MSHLSASADSFLTNSNPSIRDDSGPLDATASQPKLVDSELFIRHAFETDPEKGYQFLFKRYYPVLCSHAARFLYSKELAEDVVIEVLTGFWEKQLHKSVTTSYRAYLFTSFRHAAFACLRTEFRRQVEAETWDDTSCPQATLTPQHVLQYNELYLKIEEEVRSLPPQCQKVFIMSRFEGKKNLDIAQEMQLSVKTVEGHITKVLARLRESLREYLLISLLLIIFLAAGQGIESLFSLLQEKSPA